jgi:hypothetical protein
MDPAAESRWMLRTGAARLLKWTLEPEAEQLSIGQLCRRNGCSPLTEQERFSFSGSPET